MNSLRLESRVDGVVLSIRARPAARHNAIEGTHAGALRVAVTAAPEKAKVLRVRKSNVRLVSGATSGEKRFLVAGTTLESARDVLERHLADG